MKKNISIEIASFLLILLFVYAALSKLFNYQDFKVQLKSSPVINKYAGVIAIVLPLVELITVVLLSIQKTRRAGFVLSFLMMISFTAYILYMLLFEKHLPCSCGGVLQSLNWKQHLEFNIFFCVIAFTGIMLDKNK